MNIDAIYRILEGYTPQVLFKAYQDTLAQYNIISVGTTLGIVAALFIFFNLYIDTVLAALGFTNDKGRLTKTGPPDFKKLMGIFKPLFYIVLVVFSYPHILKGLESLFFDISASLGGENAPMANLRDIWYREAQQYQKMMSTTSTWDVGKKLFIVINYISIMVFKPFMILIEQDIFSLFLTLRYLYLIILELFGGIALAAYLHPDTKIYFYTWLKHMLFCNVFIVVLGIANFMAEQVFVRDIETSGTILSYNILSLAFVVVVKLFLFRQSFNLLLSKIF